MKEMKLTCITCPLGCSLKAWVGEDGEVERVEGNTCKRGEIYAKNEIKTPKRVLTSTMRDCGGKLISVKSAGPLPKGKLFDCMKVINSHKIDKKVKIGDIVISNILETGIDIVATKNS